MKKVLLVIVLAMLAVAIMPAAAQDKPFAGKKIVITTQTGSAIGGPAQKYGQEWAEKNGATIEVQQFAFGDLFPKIIESVKNDTAAFDILIYASDWMGDIAGGGYVSEVPEAIKTAVGWDDILPLYRERIANWGGKTYAIPFDGDSHMMYYRKDLVNPTSAYAADFQAKYGYELAEPKTWAQYKDIAEFFNGKDVDTAGTMGPISGVVEAQKRSAQSFWFLMTRSAGYAKVPGNPYFFFNEEMKAQVNTPGWVKGLQDWVDISPYGVSGMINFDVSEVRQLFPAGQTVFGLDWGDVGPISVDPNASVVKGLVGFSPAPGGDQYWDPAADGGKGAWVKPESGVNSAPFISFGGWVMSVAANSQVQEAAFDLAAYLGGQELSTTLSVTGGTHLK